MFCTCVVPDFSPPEINVDIRSSDVEVDDIADLDKTDFEDGYNGAYKIDCEDVEYYYEHVSQFEEDLARRFNECEDLLLRKHKDYGPSNIANAPGGALNGLRVRMHDKLARINHLIDSGCLPENESLRDSVVDLANYAVIALMVLDNKWPEA